MAQNDAFFPIWANMTDELERLNERRKVSVKVDHGVATLVSPHIGKDIFQINLNELDLLITTLNKYSYSSFHFGNPSELEGVKPFSKKEHKTLHNQIIIEDDFKLTPDSEFTDFGYLNLGTLDLFMCQLYTDPLLKFCSHYDNYSKADEYYVMTQIRKMVALGLNRWSGIYIKNLNKIEGIAPNLFQTYFPSTVATYCRQHNIIL